MSLHSSMSLKAQNKRIERDQTGKVDEMTLEEKIAFYDGEINRAKGWLSYYTNPRKPKNANPKMAAVHMTMIANFEKKREELRAQLYAQQLDEALPTFGGAMQLARVTK